MAYRGMFELILKLAAVFVYWYVLSRLAGPQLRVRSEGRSTPLQWSLLALILAFSVVGLGVAIVLIFEMWEHLAELLHPRSWWEQILLGCGLVSLIYVVKQQHQITSGVAEQTHAGMGSGEHTL